MAKVPLDALINRSKIFAMLDDEGRHRLASIATEQTVPPNTVVMREGEPGDAFYLLLEGTLAVDAADFVQNERRVAELSAGSVFGEIAALTHEPRTATVTSDSAARLLRFEMVSVFNVLKDYPEVLANLKRLGVERSEDLLEKLSE